MKTPQKGLMKQILTALLLLTTTQLHAAEKPFEVVGIGGAGGMFTPAVSPQDPNLMFISCDMGGVYRSTDGGKHWAMLHWRQLNTSLACRPLFVGDAILWISGPTPKISRDKGATWQELLSTKTLPWKGQVIRMAADSTDSAVLLFGTDASELWRSTDTGKTWRLSRSGKVHAILGLGKKLYAAVDKAFFISTDKGDTWEEINLGASVPEAKEQTFLSLTGGSANGVTVLFGSIADVGMLRSLDEGKTWKLVDTAWGCTEVVMAENQTKIVYAAQTDSSEARFMYRTQDGGETWKDCFRMKGRRNVQPSWVQTELIWGYYFSRFGVSVSATDAKIALLSTQGDFYLTRDGGDSWQQMMNEVVAPKLYRCTGLEVTSCWKFLFDPFDKNRRYINYTDIGFTRSTDQGETWSWSAQGCPWYNTFYEVIFDPVVPGRMYAATSSRHDIPNWTAIAALKPGPNSMGGVCISEDAGATWKPLNKGLPLLPCTSICRDPRELQTLYTTLYEGGCYKSVDGGLTWTNKSTGLGNPGNLHAYKVFVHPKTGEVYCSITAFRKNGNEYPVPGGLWKSSNGGDSWIDLTQDLKLHWPAGFAVNPNDPNVIYIAAASIKGGLEGGIYATRDGGKTWKRLLKDEDFFSTGGLPYVQAFHVNLEPGHPDHVYLSTGTHGLWVSLNDGQTWQRLEGLPFISVNNVTFDPDNADLMYVATFGGGVWRGPRLP